MFLTIDSESEEPIYRQLIMQLLMGIARGELAPGEPLASVRQMASDLGINMHTVNKVYTLLRQEGYLVVNRQKGVMVASAMPEADDAFKESLSHELISTLTAAACRSVPREEVLMLCAQAYDQLFKGEK